MSKKKKWFLAIPQSVECYPGSVQSKRGGFLSDPTATPQSIECYPESVQSIHLKRRSKKKEDERASERERERERGLYSRTGKAKTK